MHDFFGALEFLLGGKNVFSQPLPCKKNCCEICHIFFSTNIYTFFFFLIFMFFLIQKKQKFMRIHNFHLFQD